jgi:hypothetical protein
LIKKLATAATIVGASVVLGAPSATAAPAATPYFAGVYPNAAAAFAACNDGLQQGRWVGCMWCPDPNSSATQLWITVEHGPFSLPGMPPGCKGTP